MESLKLALRNALRHRLRTALTVLGLVIAILAFGLLQTVVDAWYAGAEGASNTRLVTRNSISLVFSLPITYRDKIRRIPGVTGVSMATKVLAKELSRYRIRVNCIAVTLVEDTPSWNAAEGAGDWSDEKRERYRKIQERAPFGLADPADIGSVAAFLASDSARLITGATISPTGGLTYS